MVTHLTLGGIFSGLSLLAGIAIAWMLSGRIVGPLQQLQRDALSLASGDLTHRTTVKTDDEVGNLAEAFNRMAASWNGGNSNCRSPKTRLPRSSMHHR